MRNRHMPYPGKFVLTSFAAWLLFAAALFACGLCAGQSEEPRATETLEQIKHRLAAETADAYRNCPYSAERVWSADRYQFGFIEKLVPGAGVLTEIEKDEMVAKPDGVVKRIWDYSIDLIGPGGRAKKQVAACRAAGVPIYVKSEPELGFEAPRLPYIPCLDRWADRAEALVSCGANGAWVFPYFRPCFGGTSTEAFKFFWWNPAPAKEAALRDLAGRVAGCEAAPHLGKAWKHASDAVDWSPSSVYDSCG